MASWSPKRERRDKSLIMQVTVLFLFVSELNRVKNGYIESAVLREFRDQAQLFEAMERCSPEDFEFIKTVLNQDPKKYLRI